MLFLLFFCLSDGPSACCPVCLLQHSLPVTLSVCLCICCFICSTIVCILSFPSVYGPWLSCMSFWPVVCSLLSFLFDHGLSTYNFTFVWPPRVCLPSYLSFHAQFPYCDLVFIPNFLSSWLKNMFIGLL